MTLGRRVHIARLQRELGVNELDRLLEKKAGYTSRLESGGYENPRRDTLLALSDVLGLRLEWLMRGVGPMWLPGVEPGDPPKGPSDHPPSGVQDVTGARAAEVVRKKKDRPLTTKKRTGERGE